MQDDNELGPLTAGAAGQSKMVDPSDIFIANANGTGTGRFSHGGAKDKSKDALLLENIVSRLNEEKKFNQLHSEPDSDRVGADGEERYLIDRETRELIGNTDNRDLLPQNSRKTMAVETTRERIENNLSYRSAKSHA